MQANSRLREEAFTSDNYRVIYEQKPYADYNDLIETLISIDNLGIDIQNADWVKLKELIGNNKNIIFAEDFELYNKVLKLNDNSIYITTVDDNLKTILDVRESMEKAYKGYKPPKEYKPSGGGGGGSGSSYFVPSSVPTNVSKPEEIKSSKPSDVVVFDDLENAKWAKESIEFLYNKSIISGDGAGKFRPADSITREEFVKILCSAFGVEPVSGGQEAEFLDVNKEAWYYSYLNTAIKNGIVFGRDDGNFGIGESISREDMAVMIHRMLNKQGIAENTETNIVFSDLDIVSPYALEAVKTLSSLGIINGMGNNVFAPQDTATRAQAAVMIFNVYQNYIGGKIS